jgi:hypothetical protein
VTLHLKKIGKWLLHLAEVVLAIWVILVLLPRQGFLLRGPASETASPTNRTLLAADFSLPDLEGGWQRLSHFRGLYSMGGMGHGSRMATRPEGYGIFSTVLSFSMPGTWSAEVMVRRPGLPEVRVPFSLRLE